MLLAIGIPIGLIVLFILWIAFIYNSLVRGRNTCTESWSNVDTELKRRYDLIPNLVETVKGYAKHEREVLEQVTQARAAAIASQGSPASQAKDENALVGGLRQLLAVAEQYPDLKASHFNIEFNGIWVIAYREELFAPGYFPEALQLLTGIVDNLPESMVRELGEGRRRV